jgi:hypothetical protein
LIYTADLPTTPYVTTATYADDAAILSPHQDPTVSSQRLQSALNKIQSWMKKRRIRVNEGKFVQVTFTTRRNTCPPVSLNNRQLKQCEVVRYSYLGMHLDRRMTWKKHICTKRKQLGIKFGKLNWLIGRKSQLSLYNKVLVYKAMLKPIWSYGIQLWGSASKSNIEILERFQAKVLLSITDAPWYVPNSFIARDLSIMTVKAANGYHSNKFKSMMNQHLNSLVQDLMLQSTPSRLKRFLPSDLPTRFKPRVSRKHA